MIKSFKKVKIPQNSMININRTNTNRDFRQYEAYRAKISGSRTLKQIKGMLDRFTPLDGERLTERTYSGYLPSGTKLLGVANDRGISVYLGQGSQPRTTEGEDFHREIRRVSGILTICGLKPVSA